MATEREQHDADCLSHDGGTHCDCQGLVRRATPDAGRRQACYCNRPPETGEPHSPTCVYRNREAAGRRQTAPMTDDDLASRAEDLAFARGCEYGNECWWDCVAATLVEEAMRGE